MRVQPRAADRSLTGHEWRTRFADALPEGARGELARSILLVTREKRTVSTQRSLPPGGVTRSRAGPQRSDAGEVEMIPGDVVFREAVERLQPVRERHAGGGHEARQPLKAGPGGIRGLSRQAWTTAIFITIEAGKGGGKPCIRRMRITVCDFLDYLAGGGMSEGEILSDFPGPHQRRYTGIPGLRRGPRA